MALFYRSIGRTYANFMNRCEVRRKRAAGRCDRPCDRKGYCGGDGQFFAGNVGYSCLWVFAVLAYMGIGLALQSTSGVAGISMPILGAVAAALFMGSAIGSIGGDIILISAFAIGLNFMTIIYPGAVNLGTCELFGVPYNSFLKYMLKYAIPLLLVATILLSIAPYIGLVF